MGRVDQTIQTQREREYRNFDDIPIVLPHIAFILAKGWITDLKWNETTKYLAASSYGGWIKVKFHSFVVNWLTNGKRTGQEMTSLISYFPLFSSLFQIWSMDSDEPVHSLEVDYSNCESLAWRPNGKTEDVDGGIAARDMTVYW